MRSFSTIASIAAVAFAAFTSAAPINVAVPGVVSAEVTSDVLPEVPAIPTIPGVPQIISRQTETPSLPEILSDVIDKVTPIVNELGSLTSENATVDVITPLTDALNTVLNDGITELNALIGSPIETIMATAEGLMDISGVTKLVGSLLTLVFTTLGAVLNLTGAVAGGNGDAIFTVLSNVGNLVGQLLQVVLSLVGSMAGGLTSSLLPLVGGILPIVSGLGLNSVFGILGNLL